MPLKPFVRSLFVAAALLSTAIRPAAQPATTPPDLTLETPFERDTLASATYPEAVAYYETLARAFPERCRLWRMGPSDVADDLLVFVVSDAFTGDGALPPGTSALFVNNGIHAGEPCGVDASMLLARGLLRGRYRSLDLAGAAVYIVPAYNLGGMLDRGRPTRTNQVGPRAYGFRGNAQNLDLNRDFVKRDSENARTLTRYLHALRPDVFVDTHTTNGADYAYAMTVIATQYEKLGPVLGPFLRHEMEPALYRAVERQGYPIAPYVNADGVPQESGIDGFVEGPRYSTGFTALQHTIGFVSEAHMLKPFATRVRATEAFLGATLEFWLDHRTRIAELRRANAAAAFAADSVALAWAIDPDRADTIAFRGFAAVREASAVTGAERLRYDRARPVTVPTAVRSYARATRAVRRPRYYYVPHAYRDLVSDALGSRALAAATLTSDTVLQAVAYRIDTFATVDQPYEGHYLHYAVRASRVPRRVTAHAGDLLIAVTPANLAFLSATLEPEAPDSYFAWGFFDSWLQQKEHFSAYVFEDTAAEMLRAKPRLRAEFEARRAGDDAFRQNPRAQLTWLHERSDNFEPGFGLLPVVRVE